jgi:hypothetical protein
MTLRLQVFLSVLVLSLVVVGSVLALDTPTVTIVDEGFGKAVLNVTAGESGAPYGFTVWWMKESDYIANGNQMTYYPSSIQGAASFTGVPTLNTWNETLLSFVLEPNQTAKVEIGDLLDETGVTTNTVEELVPGTRYVFCASANAEVGGDYAPASEFSQNESTETLTGQDCTYTHGFWKTHGPGECHNGNNPNMWPVNSVTLGNVVYTDLEACAILNEPTHGNGLVSMARQLIATKLNIANGANPAAIASTVAAADQQIGNLVIPPIGDGYIHPSQTSSKTQALDDYNSGITGPGHCPPVSVEETSWGQVKSAYR